MLVILLLLAPFVVSVKYEQFNISGAGATFPSDVYELWKSLYSAQTLLRRVSLNFTYDPVGSGRGKKFIIDKNVTYGASDANLTLAEAQNPLNLFPVIAGSMAVVYNIPTFSQDLLLNGEALVGIFNGTITQWNDPILVQLNSALLNVSQSIRIVRRSDSSGSTEVLTRYLSSHSLEWSNKYNIFTSISGWPRTNASFAESGSTGIVKRIIIEDYSISYVDLALAIRFKLKYASLLNSAGSLTFPNLKALESSMNDFTAVYSIINPKIFYVPIVDGPGKLSYPLATYSYFVLRDRYPDDCKVMYELMRYVHWIFYNPSAKLLASSYDFSTLSDGAVSYVSGALNKVRCQNGLYVWKRVKYVIYEEEVNKEGRLFALSFLRTGLILLVLVFVLLKSIWATRKQEDIHLDVGANSDVQLKLIKSYQKDVDDVFRSSFKSKLIEIFVYCVVDCGLIALDWNSYLLLPVGIKLTESFFIVCVLGSIIVGCTILHLFVATIMFLNRNPPTTNCQKDVREKLSIEVSKTAAINDGNNNESKIAMTPSADGEARKVVKQVQIVPPTKDYNLDKSVSIVELSISDQSKPRTVTITNNHSSILNQRNSFLSVASSLTFIERHEYMLHDLIHKIFLISHVFIREIPLAILCAIFILNDVSTDLLVIIDFGTVLMCCGYKLSVIQTFGADCRQFMMDRKFIKEKECRKS